MNAIEHSEVAINLSLFKMFRFYHLFNPNSKTIFNFNVYRLIIVMFVLIIQCIVILGTFIFFTKIKENDFDSTHTSHFVLFVLVNSLNMLKVITFIYKVNDVWVLFDVTRIDFLTSRQCRKYVGILRKYRLISIQNTNFFSMFLVSTFVVWSLFPFIYYLKNTWEFGIKQANNRDSINNRRTENILNCMFPVTVSTYNTYYVLFYLIELMITVMMLYIRLFYQIFFISFYCVFIAQYEVIARAFRNVDYCKEKNSIYVGETDLFIN